MAASESRPHAGDSLHLSELRIVLLGIGDDGKSSSGNIILGREEFGTVGRIPQCVKRQGEVAGRHVTVVEAPGWKTLYTEYTPSMIKEEIELSVSLCPPGPHILLLIILLNSSFNKNHRTSVQEHLELLGERVWSHTMVLFICGDRRGETTIEQHIESEGESLQWLVEKCGNRYHVFNNMRRDDMQVTQLMEKIEEIVAANRGQCYEMERWRIEELEEKRKRDEERGKERMMKVKKKRESLRSEIGDSFHLSELRIVLLGFKYEGKSSSGNTILGREEFDTVGRTAQCVKKQGEVAGRHVTVVEAPGWGRDCSLDDTPNITKEEIVCSVSLCPPGPHALLLVLDLLEPRTESNRKSVQEHLELLGERVWSHTIVLFIHGDRLGDTPIELHIESEGESLQWLVEKCGNRYHVFNNERRNDHIQATELMEKIEEMVAANRGQCYEMERWIILDLQEKRKRDEERGKERMMKVKRERESLRSEIGDSFHLSELRIVLLGFGYEGKSSAGNTILGREVFDTVGRTAQCVKKQGEVAGRHVTVVEAPGWGNSLDDTPNITKEEIVCSVSLCPPGPHALLLVLDLLKPRTESNRKFVQEHLELLVERVWSHTIVLFIHGDWLGDTPIELHIESEGESLQWLVEKCGNRYHVFNNMRRDDHMQVTQLMEKIEEMVAANRGQCYEMERCTIEELQEKRRREEERVKERMMMVKKNGESLLSQMGDSLHLSELRIVLLGNINSGKSSSGNTILGREEFGTVGRTAQCVKKQGEVAGRHVTVVEAPGWIWSIALDLTPSMTKEEIVRSMSLCPPGPHAILLAIRSHVYFTEELRRSVQKHLELLGERVWSHTIVLFTWGDKLIDTPIELHIERGGESLQWLVEKCGNRYHVFNNKRRDDHMQVTQLMEKIEEMVAANRGQCYEMEGRRIKELEEKRRRDEKRMKKRMLNVKRRRESLRSQIGDSLHLSEFRIVLLGIKYEGKSSSGNTILGRQEFGTVGAAQCVERQGDVAGRHVTVVEAPAWNGHIFTTERTPNMTKTEIELSVSLCPPGPHALLLVISVNRPFTKRFRRSVQGHLELLGERVWSHMIVLFTWGDWLGDTPIEQHIEREGESLQWLVEKCGNRYHVFNNSRRDDHMQVTQLMEKIEETVAANRGQCYEMERRKMEELQEKRRRDEERGKERLMKVKRERESLRSEIGDSLHQLRIVLLGYRREGKSSSGNTILGRQGFGTVGAAQCVERRGEVAGRHVTVVEAPGWTTVYTTLTPNMTKKEIKHSVSLCSPGPHALLLVVSVIRRFTKQFRISMKGHLELLGERLWSHMIVLFTCGDWLGDTPIEQHIRGGLTGWASPGWPGQKGANSDLT